MSDGGKETGVPASWAAAAAADQSVQTEKLLRVAAASACARSEIVTRTPKNKEGALIDRK